MAVVGNLNDYVKFQLGQGLAQGGGGSAPAEKAMGFALAQQMIQQSAGAGSATPAPAAPAAAGLPELLAPVDAARLLGVTEADKLATIQSGELKAKKIGSVFRITRTAMDEFLRH